jgi:hypothetical protein
MGDATFVVGHLLFWVFGGCAALLPLRWGIPFYLLVVQIDSSGPELASASTVGFENTLKIILLPTLFLLRIGWKRFKPLYWPSMSKSWLLFVSYVALAAIWSPFQLSAIKMVGYLYCYAALFTTFTYAAFQGWITEKVLAVIAVSSLALGAIQTYFLGNLFGFGGTENRFTTFSDTETFAAFLIALLSLFLFSAETQDRFRRIACIVGLVLGIILTGSRYVFLGLVILFLAASVFYTLQTVRKIRLGLLLRRVSLGLVPAVLVFGMVVQYFPQNRLNELTQLSSSHDIEDIGTFGFRLAIYQLTMDQLAEHNLRQWIFGTGTSSGAEVALKFDPALYKFDTVDGNRIIHDEFLRALYEWGWVGLSLFVYFLVMTVKSCVELFRRTRRREVMAFLAIFPTLLIGLAVGNVLAEAGLPGGTGYVLVLACAAASRFQSGTGQRRRVAGGTSSVLHGGLA